jgi:hypothetical protein
VPTGTAETAERREKRGKEGVFAQTDKADYSKNIGFIPTKVRNPPI